MLPQKEKEEWLLKRCPRPPHTCHDTCSALRLTHTRTNMCTHTHVSMHTRTHTLHTFTIIHKQSNSHMHNSHLQSHIDNKVILCNWSTFSCLLYYKPVYGAMYSCEPMASSSVYPIPVTYLCAFSLPTFYYDLDQAEKKSWSPPINQLHHLVLSNLVRYLRENSYTEKLWGTSISGFWRKISVSY